MPDLDLSHIDHWVFDLDNTLYSAGDDFFSQIDQKMTAFISDYLKLEPLQARKVQKDYLAEYGTSLSGLMAVNGMDPEPFLDFVHDVDLSPLKPCPNLRGAIEVLSGKKYIFTNGSKKHAENVGTYLGVYDLFDGVFGIEDVDYVPKPKRSPYIKFCDVFDIDPQKAIMFEDSVRNLEVPKYMGMQTVWVTPDQTQPVPAKWIDHMTQDLSAWLTASS